MHSPPTYAHAQRAHRCPTCGQPIVRIQRRPLDRLHSVFVPVWRFACSSRNCGWTDTIRRADLRIPLIA
jgi:hypothetical protein